MGTVFMNKNKFIILFSILCLFLIIPTSFAFDVNATIVAESSQTSDYYFDANIENDTGDGSITNPYKKLTSNRISDNSNLHLADGEYDLDWISYVNNVTISGTAPEKTVISYSGGIGFNLNGYFALSNLTLKELAVENDGYNFTANNVIFTKVSSTSVISSYMASKNSNSFFDNCTFADTYASNGGAINVNEAKVFITNSLFSNNGAKDYGGAIYCKNSALVEISNSKFINDEATNEAGGAIYQIDSILSANNVEIYDCYAPFGGAITSLNSELKLDNFTSKNNRAKYYGGSVYSLFHSFSISNSTLINNTADKGGALFADGVDDFKISHNVFINNTASLGSAVYSILSEFYYDSIYNELLNNSFENNEVFESDILNLTINNQTILIKLNSSSLNDTLPSYYNLRDLGLVTSVKNQGGGGNCWSFSAIAALESSVLKATGKYLDLSEENMKNIMSYYSSYGWSMDTNKGGYDKMAIGYFTGWIGPVNDSEDSYNGESLLSPLLDSFMHIQNIVFLKRENYTDNDEIKTAVMKYGAVSTSLYWSTTYAKGKNYYFDGTSSSNHAVIIVGWDDTYSKSNFKGNPKGDGAWIIKNSWGTYSGDGGFYYVSYYDTKFAQPGRYTSYAFILNDTIRYDKNYQYDIQGRTDTFFNTTHTVWYKNKFTATDNEYLAAVSTYFENETAWDLSVYVNNILELTQSGKSAPSYSTIDLDRFIPICAGDVFEIVFKITVDGDAGFPISESVSLNRETYKENMSFVSYDGINWTDLYDLEWTYPGHVYASQVACIKAFTFLNPMDTSINFNIINNSSDSVDIIATVTDQYGNLVNGGNVTFTIGDVDYVVKAENGIGKYSGALIKEGINKFSASFEGIGYNRSSNFVLFSWDLIDTTISFNFSSNNNPVILEALVKDKNGNNVEYGFVTFNVEGINYVVEVNDGIAKLNHTFTNFGLNNISIDYDGLYCYKSSKINQSIAMNINKVSISLDADSKYNPVGITAKVVDEQGVNVDVGYVRFVMDGSSYDVCLINGEANITHVFKNVGSSVNRIEVYFYDDSFRYNATYIKKYIPVSLKQTTLNINLNHDNVVNPVNITVTVKDYAGKLVDCGTITLKLNDETRVIDVDNGIVSIDYVFKETGINNISASYSDDYYYAGSTKTAQVNVSRIDVDMDVNIRLLKDSSKITVDFSKPINEYVTIYVNNKYHLVKSSEGHAVLSLDYSDIYNVKVSLASFIYDSKSFESINSKISCNVETLYYDKTVSIPVALKDEHGNAIVNGEVSMTIGGKTFFTVTNNSGIALFSFNIKSGEYDVYMCYKGGNKYVQSDLNKKIKIKSTIILPSTVKYTLNSNYKAVLLDSYGNLLKNSHVSVMVNSKQYDLITSSEGILNFNIALAPNTYVLHIENSANKEVSTQTIDVVSRLNSNKDLTMYYGAGSSYKVRAYDDNGKVAKGVKVTFKINGKTYARTTDSNGYASFKISLAAKTYTITATYQGFKVSNKVVVKPTLILSTKTVKKSKTFKYNVKLLNNKGKIVKNKKITVKFRGKTYKATTNSKGIATFNIKALSKTGKYTLTAIYGSAKIGKTITIKK